jgi:alkaline phosphatase
VHAAFSRLPIIALAGLALTACSPSADNAEFEAAQPGDQTGDAVSVDGPETSSGNATWDRAREEALARTRTSLRPQRARNVVLFVADGMSIATITAARIHQGQVAGLLGAEHRLAIDNFEASALVRTYSTNRQVADSASAATALLTGYKTYSGAISIATEPSLESCASDAVNPATLLEIAEDRGLSTGIVTTTRLTHATPASAYAHSASRAWEVDTSLPDFALAAGCRDIAAQFLDFDHGDGPEVALGGGLRNFVPADQDGRRGDGRDLTAEWQAQGHVFIATGPEMQALEADRSDRVLGLFSSSHMAYEADRDPALEPSLAEMTRFALDRVSTDEDGYFLLVEAGRVDHAHHGANAYRALTDMQAFEAAIETVLDEVDLEETLVLVTADHGHVFTIAGYPDRGNPILGLVRETSIMDPAGEAETTLADDGNPYTTLGYHTGPNIRDPNAPPLTWAEVTDPNFQQQSAVLSGSETHSGSDVALYASGPRAHYFTGSMEQNTVFHLIMAAWDWPVEGAAEALD